MRVKDYYHKVYQSSNIPNWAKISVDLRNSLYSLTILWIPIKLVIIPPRESKAHEIPTTDPSDGS